MHGTLQWQARHNCVTTTADQRVPGYTDYKQLTYESAVPQLVPIVI